MLNKLPPPHLSPSDTVEGGDFFSKEMSVMMAGFAILLMMWHHLFNFPERLTEGVIWESMLGEFGLSSTKIVGEFGNICVQVFALMSGYALMMRTKSFETWKKRFARLLKFLLPYWMVNMLFLCVGYLNDDILPGVSEIMLNSIGLMTGPSVGWINVTHAWYVCYYIVFILISPLLIWGFSSNRKVLDFAMAISIFIFVYLIKMIPAKESIIIFLGYLTPLLSSTLGVIIAKYGIFNKLHRLISSRLHWSVLIIIIVMLIIIRNTVEKLNPYGGLNWSFFIQLFFSVVAATFILVSVELFYRIRSRHFKYCFLLMGSLSMYLWFLHGIFHTGKNFMQPFIYAPKEPILILVLCTVTLLPVAWALKKFQGYIDKKLSFL